jgi:hypothetical protein
MAATVAYESEIASGTTTLSLLRDNSLHGVLFYPYSERFE